MPMVIYNSRNYYRLLNEQLKESEDKSTTVEITIGYLTHLHPLFRMQSTTVEITIGYLTMVGKTVSSYLQQ